MRPTTYLIFATRTTFELPKRISKRVKTPRNIWVRELASPEPELIADLDFTADELLLRTPSGSVCAVCKGSKLLCGKTRCPVIARLTSQLKITQKNGLIIIKPPVHFLVNLRYRIRFGREAVYISKSRSD